MNTTVGEVMTRSVVSAYPDAPFKEVARVMIERGITALPVIDEDHYVIGVVSESDLLARESFAGERRSHWPRRGGGGRVKARASGTTAGELMTTPTVSVRPETTIVRAARLLDQHRIKRLPVIDAEGRLLGIVSRRDLLRVFTRTDAEIRDEILREVFTRLLSADPAAVSVRVNGGVVTLTGTLQQKNLIPIAVRLAAATEGVVSVIDQLSHADEVHKKASRR